MASVKDQGDEELYERLDASYPTDDDDNKVFLYLIFFIFFYVLNLHLSTFLCFLSIG